MYYIPYFIQDVLSEKTNSNQCGKPSKNVSLTYHNSKGSISWSFPSTPSDKSIKKCQD
jgi:hypothetical protein